MPAISFIDTRDRSVRLGSFKDGFVALSYVWGKPTGSEPLHSSHKRLPPSCVPVIEDAIEATKQLGYRYLWVDRYRVDQIDPDVKHSQVVQMDKIYSAAALTIISDGDDARLGLPGVSHPRTPHERLGIGEHSLEIVEPAELVLQKSPRASRGWTYQERFFSFHSVVFSQHQIYLECQKGTFTPESMPGASIEQQGSKGFNFMDWEALRSVQKNDKTLTAYRADGKTIVNRDVQKRKPPILRALEYHIYHTVEGNLVRDVDIDMQKRDGESSEFVSSSNLEESSDYNTVGSQLRMHVNRFTLRFSRVSDASKSMWPPSSKKWKYMVRWDDEDDRLFCPLHLTGSLGPSGEDLEARLLYEGWSCLLMSRSTDERVGYALVVGKVRADA